MSLDASSVRLSITGTFAIAPYGSNFPRDASTPLTPVWHSVGYISEEGVTESTSDESSQIVPWRTRVSVRNDPGVVSTQYSFSLVEVNVASMSVYYQELMGPGATQHYVAASKGLGLGFFAAVFTVVDGDWVSRRWIPRCQVVSRGDVVFGTQSEQSFPVVVEAFPAGDVMGDGRSARSVVFYSEGLIWPGPPDQLPKGPPTPFGLNFGADFDTGAGG